jgi:YbgC/YbaW family acyl-CoA thioester hydrolase
MTAFATVQLTVYPQDCDAFGHLNHAALLALLERARWESLALGPGMDLFHRNGVAPVVRKAVVDYRAPAFPNQILRVEMTIVHRGTTSWTIRHTATRVVDGELVAEADVVLVCLDRAGRPTPLPDELARLLGPRTGTGHVARRVPVDGAELAVEVRGEGSAILFVHGFPFDRGMWRHQLAGLSRWKRIAVDLRGVGESSAGSGEYSMERYADDLIAVLDAVGVRQAVVCGLSMGGYILFELLRRYPERVRAAVLCDTRAGADTEEGRRNRDTLTALATESGPEAVAERLLSGLLGAATLADQPEIMTQCREMARRYSVPGMVGALRAMRERPDSTPLLATIRVPTLVMVGAEDRPSPPAQAQAMADAIPGARYALIPGAGHLAPLEQPLATSRVLGEFLEALGSP